MCVCLCVRLSARPSVRPFIHIYLSLSLSVNITPTLTLTCIQNSSIAPFGRGRHLPKPRRGVALSFAKERDHRALSLFHYDPFIPAGQTGGAAPYRL